MIDPKSVFYLETGEMAEIQCYDVFNVPQDTKIANGYVHWLEDKYRQLIELSQMQTERHV